MKKILFFNKKYRFITIILLCSCFFLVNCNNTNNEELQCTLKLKINPEFIITVQENNQDLYITHISGEDSIAKAILNELDINEKSLKEGIYLLFNHTYDYLNLTKEVSIECFDFESLTININPLLKDIIESYQEEKNISFSYHILTTYSNIKEEEQTETSFEEERYEEIEYDDNGRLIKTVEKVNQHYITLYYNEKNEVVARIYEDIYYPNIQEEYLENGTITKRIYRDSTKTTIQEYSKYGDVTIEYVDDTEKNTKIKRQYTYYANKEIKTCVTNRWDNEHPDGYFREEHYYEDGTFSFTHEMYDDNDIRFYYDKNGNITKFAGKDEYGYPVTGEYNVDGSYELRIYEPTRVRIESYDKNGNVHIEYEEKENP